MAEIFKATKLKLSDYEIMLTLGTGIQIYKPNILRKFW